MSPERLAALIVGIICLVIVISLALRFLPKRVRPVRFQKKWKELQKYCAHKETWPRALLDADQLLDEALKRRKFKGSNMGERLVAAQRKFTDNESVWWSHKLVQRLRDNPQLRLRKKDVKDALLAFGQSLKDLGALK